MSENEKKPEEQATPETSAEVVKSSGNNVEVSGEMLQEAVVQLRRLTELRQKEAERQERAISQMNATIRKNAMLNRLVLFASALVVLVVFGLAFMIKTVNVKQEAAASAIQGVESTLSATAATVSKSAEQQIAALSTVKTELTQAKDEQIQIVKGMQAELASTRDGVSEKIETTRDEIIDGLQASRQVQTEVAQKIDSQLEAVRSERDAVREEVFNAIDTRSREFTERELALIAEKEHIEELKKLAAQERRDAINEAIARLKAMNEALMQEAEGLAPEAASTETSEPAVTAEEEVETESAPAVDTEAVIENTGDEAVATEADVAEEGAAEEVVVIEDPVLVEAVEADVEDAVEVATDAAVEVVEEAVAPSVEAIETAADAAADAGDEATVETPEPAQAP
ncbi:MAG: hypothetical protein KDL31_04935 [Kiritimatiellae bacterium]|nr:hypothetical protein [Kiritimatiellia bacterium]